MGLDACDGGNLFPCDAGGATFPEVDFKNGKLQSTIKFGKRSEKHIFREMMVRFAATLVVERFLKKMQIRNATQW